MSQRAFIESLVATGTPIATAPRERGVCWGCGCTQLRACQDPETGEGCAWANSAEDFCSVCALFVAKVWMARALGGSEEAWERRGGLIES